MLNKLFSFFKVDFHENRIYGFDIIRTAAIVSVLLGHGSFIIPGDPGSFYTNAFNFLDGVFVFFVLSGFLIGEIMIYTIENKPITKETLIIFWKKRLLRTLPAYYVVLTSLIILSLLFVKGFGKLYLLLYYILSQNFCTSHPYFFAEAWTLSIEVWFYFFIPLTVFILKGYYKFSDKSALLTTIIIYIVLGFLIRWIKTGFLVDLDNGVVGDQMFRKQVITRIDSVTYGVLGAYIFRYYKQIWLNYKNLFLVIGVSIFLYTKYPIFNHGHFFKLVAFYSLQSLSFLLILPFFSQIKSGKGLIFNIITTLSYVSFSIYLLNLNMVQTFILNNISFGSLSGNYLMATKYILYLILSIGGGIAMYKCVELPFMNLRKKLK